MSTIDVLFCIIAALGAVRGFTRGLILALFALAAYVIGLAAAVKFSHWAGEGLQPLLHVGARWMPLIAFLLVFVGVVLVVRWTAKLLEKVVEGLMLGWLNRLGGMAFYILLYTTIYSVLLYYLVGLGLVRQDTLRHSVTYAYIAPVGPKVVGGLGAAIPWFRGLFENNE